MEERNRFIYDLLVNSDQDVVGQIAYSLYKADKIAYIEKYKEDHNDEEPPDEKLNGFKDYCQMNSHLDMYRMRAVELINGFMNDTMKETLNQLECDFNKNHLKHLASVVEPMKPPKRSKQFWHGVVQSICGAFFFAIIVAAFKFITEYKTGDDLIPVPESHQKHNVQPPAPADSTATFQ